MSNQPFESMKRLFPLSKTLAFRLVPLGETERNMRDMQTRERAFLLSGDYKILKEAADRVHKRYIEETLSKFHLKYLSDGGGDSIQEYADAFNDPTLPDAEREAALSKIAEKLKEQIGEAFKAPRFSAKATMLQALASQALLKDILPKEELSPAETSSLGRLGKYTTYMRPYFEARARLYEPAQGGHTIPVRTVDDNLPIHLVNVRTFSRLPGEIISQAAPVFGAVSGRLMAYELQDVFTPSAYSALCAQSAIDAYNTLIGGISLEDGSRIQGLNELVNQHNQGVRDKAAKLRPFKKLRKQILSDHRSLSWLPARLEDDAQAVAAAFVLEELLKGFTAPESTDWDPSRVHVSSKALSEYSKAALGNWKAAETCLMKDIQEATPKKAREGDKGYAARVEKAFKDRRSFSLAEIHAAASRHSSTEGGSPEGEARSALRLYYMNRILAKVEEARSHIAALHAHVSEDGTPDAPLGQDPIDGTLGAGASIKAFLEALNDAKSAARVFTDLGGTLDTDTAFYGPVVDFFNDAAQDIKSGYDAIRNHLTRKPYRTDKVQLTFDNPKLLDGWDENKLTDNRGVILRDGDAVLLGIMPDHAKKLFSTGAHADPASTLLKIDVKYLPNPHMMLPKVAFSNKARKEGLVPPEAAALKDSNKAVKDYTPEEVALMVGHYKKAIAANHDWDVFGFTFKDSYDRLSDFYDDVASQNYTASYSGVSRAFVNEAVARGDLFLFQVTCQDMLKKHTGADGNYKALLYEALAGKGDVRLCGGAAVYHRPASLPRRVTHPAGVPIRTKNPASPHETVTYPYDIIKDRRYTEDRYAFHVPVSIYPDADAYGALSVNRRVQEIVRRNPGMYVLGINRGERNLISVAVTAPDGTIVEQRNLNVFDNFDYRRKLAERELERTENRRDWTSVRDIKNLKKGYLTRVIGEVVRLVRKYGCVIAMERLDIDFKQGRRAFEKSVYEQFERDLVSRLAFLTDKAEDNRSGTALQLANPGKTEQERTRFPQNGILFLMNPSCISSTDPITGFTNRLDLYPEKVSDAEETIGRFDGFRFNPATGRFELTFRYDKAAPGREAGDGQRVWKVETYGERTEQVTPEGAPKGTVNDKVTDLTAAMKELLTGARIRYEDGADLLGELKGRGGDFYREFYALLRLTVRITSWNVREREFRILGCTANASGLFYDSRRAPERLPKDADTLAAWNIARKCHMVLRNIREFVPGESRDADGKLLKGPRLSVSDAEWFAEVQK